jgi:hypothetical protein
MKSFLKFLYEMSIRDAEIILKLSANWTSSDLKQSYRTLSQKHHPDKGGSLKMMKQINIARGVLKGKRNNTPSITKPTYTSGSIIQFIIDDLHAQIIHGSYYIPINEPDMFIRITKDTWGRKINWTVEEIYTIKGNNMQIISMTSLENLPNTEETKKLFYKMSMSGKTTIEDMIDKIKRSKTR